MRLRFLDAGFANADVAGFGICYFVDATA